MYIDESLAKGLRTAFWRYIDQYQEALLDRIRTAIHTQHGRAGTTKAANKLVAALDKAASSPVVLHHEVSGKNKAAVWYSLYLARSQDVLNLWGEGCLRIESDRVTLHSQDWRPTWLTTTIGEHCIARM